MQEESNMYFSVTPIITFCGKTRIGYATGFFYKDLTTGDMYLITNRHVIINETKQYFPEYIVIRVHIDRHDLTKNREVKIQLYKNGKPIWIEHPNLSFDNQIGAIPDIVAIPVQPENNWLVDPLSKNIFPPLDIVLVPGDDLIVLGYPLGFYDEHHNLPIARRAALSSPFGVRFRGYPFFLVDAKLHVGTSGAPVFTKPTTAIVRKEKVEISSRPVTFFIGVHSAIYPNLELSIVWYAWIIEEIIRKSP
ncbi:MAG: hypothetical protein DRO14_04395 [Thermoprotei archaeon]|nr:MAG: hypothetical protein DRO14_04395 [Thermoprotei archaeon]